MKEAQLEEVYVEKADPPRAAPDRAVAKTGRLTWVDHARGIAIMLVVYRHVTSGMEHAGVQVSNGMSDVQELFLNFRMPVFFILSGIFVAGSLQKRSPAAVARGRAYTILYPYLLWGALFIALQILSSHMGHRSPRQSWWDMVDLVLQPRVIHLWYLLAMFNTSGLYLLLRRVIRNKWVHIAVGLGLHLLTLVPLVDQHSLFKDPFFFYIYFLIGTILAPMFLDKEKSAMLLRTENLKWLLPVFLAGQWFWFVHRAEDKTYIVLFLIINLFAAYFVYIISARISKSRHDWLAYLGKNSLYIYILHVPVATVSRTLLLHVYEGINPWVLLFVCFSLALTVPVLLTNLLKRMGMEWLFVFKPKSVK